MIGLVCLVLNIYFVVLFARILMSWFPVSADSPMAPIRSALFSVTEPLLGPLRRALPPVRLGGMAIDLSPIVVIIGLRVLQSFLGC